MASDERFPSDRFYSQLVAGSGATLLWFLLLLSLLRPLAGGEGLEWAIYLTGGSLAPLLGVLWARRAGQESAVPAAALAVAGLLFARLGGGPPVLNVMLAAAALGVLLTPAAAGLRPDDRWAAAAGVALVAVLMLLFAPQPAVPRLDPAALAIAAVLAALCFGLASKLLFRGFDALAIALIGLLVVSFRVPIEAVSADFFLAPANEILHGKTLLVETFGQYGILPLYLIGWWGRVVPLSYTSLGLLVSLISFAQYGVIYLLLKRLAGSRTVALGLTILLIGLSVFTTGYVAHSHPSVGALRFFLPYLVLLCELAPGRRRLILHAAVVGIASVWSAETFVYTLVTLGAIVLFEMLRERRMVLQPVGAAVSGVVAAHTLLALLTKMASGRWPQWAIYSKFLRAYTTGEMGALPVAAWTPWALLAAVYLGAIVAIGVLLKEDRESLAAVEWRWVAGLTGMGIVTFSYFVGRSHPFALRHIAAPALMILAFWVRNLGIKRPFFVLVAIATVLLAWNSAQGLAQNMRLTAFGSLASGGIAGDLRTLADPPAHHPESGEAAALIDKYAPGASHVPVLINDPAYTETMVLARKGNFFLVDNPLQDALLWQKVPADPRFRRLPAAGSWVFVDAPERLFALQLDYLRRLEAVYCLVPAELTSTGIRAVRLLPKTEPCPAQR